MASSLIEAYKSGIDILGLQSIEFGETFPVLNVVLVLFVVPLLMYTCRQKFTKHCYRIKSSPNSRAEEYDKDSRTKDGSIPEKSSYCLTENKVKKRRVRKKKPRKQDSECGEESKDASEARENADTKSVSEEVKVTKRRNKAVRGRGDGLDNGSYRHGNDSKNPDIPGHVEQKKYANNRDKGLRSSGPDVKNAPSRHVNDGEVPSAAGSVENVKYYVKRRNKVVGNCVRVEAENNHPKRNLNSMTHDEGVRLRRGNVKGEHCESFSTVKEVNDVRKASKVVTPRNGNDLVNNSNSSEGITILKRRNKIVSSSCTNEVDENLTSSSCSLKEGVNDIERLEKDVDSRNVDDSGENPGTVKEVKHVKILKRDPSSRPVGDAVGMVLDQNKVRWGNVTPCNRNKLSQVHNRDDSYVTDVTHVGVTQRCNAAAVVTRRRRSFSNEITKDSTGMERKENASGVEATQEYAENRSPGNFSGDVPKRGWEKLTRTSAAIGHKPMKDNHSRVYTTSRRRSFDHIFEKHLERRDHRENQRPCPIDNRSKSNEPENPEREPKEDETVTNSVELSVDSIGTMGDGHTNTPCEQAANTGMLKAQENISAETAKGADSLKQTAEYSPSPVQEIQTTSDGHVVIDPVVRQRIANPKCPVRMPERPFESLRFHDFTRRENCGKRRNKSRVNGLFGREWREEFEKKQQREFAKEDKESEESFLDIRDNICPTFMIWGVCHRGDRCHLRHPSYRYLERPKEATSSPEPVDEEPKPRDPNSYAAILEKTSSPENEEFVNDCLPKNCLTEETLDEAWPALGSPEQGRMNKVPKAWRPKRDTPNAPQVCTNKSTTQKGPWILEERTKATVDQLQIASDELIADSLQVDEYATLEVYDENNQDYYSYYSPEQEVNVDDFLENVEETNEEEENSSYTQREGKVVIEEQFSYSSSSPFILEKTSESMKGPDPPKLSSICDICMDRPKDATLVCGHRYCYQCALQMRLDERVCAICRRCIVSVIKTYN